MPRRLSVFAPFFALCACGAQPQPAPVAAAAPCTSAPARAPSPSVAAIAPSTSAPAPSASASDVALPQAQVGCNPKDDYGFRFDDDVVTPVPSTSLHGNRPEDAFPYTWPGVHRCSRFNPLVLQWFVRNSTQKLLACHDAAKRPELAGRVAVRFVIHPDGSVKNAGDAGSSTLADKKVIACVVDVFAHMEFPPELNGAKVSVEYPIVFSGR